MRRSFVFATVAMLACGKTPPATQVAVPDFSAQHAAVFARVPDNAAFAVGVAGFGKLLERGRALKQIAETGPVTQKKLAGYLARAEASLGFDPLDAAAWAAHGVSDDAAAVLWSTNTPKNSGVVVKTRDPEKLRAWLATHEGAGVCAVDAGLLVCADHEAAPATGSLWARMKNEPLAHSPIVGYAPLDFQKASLGEYVGASQSVIVGLTLTEERISFGARYANPKTGALKKYFKADQSGGLLGAAADAMSVARMQFSPSALWALAGEKTPKQSLDAVTGGVQAATGIDLEKDVIRNLTGEMVAAMWEPSAFITPILLGTRDDKATADLLRRLDGVIAGALASLPKSAHRVERSHGVPVYVYDLNLDLGDATKNLPMKSFSIHLASYKHAIVIAFDDKNRERALDGVGRSPSRLLDRLDGEARQALSDDNFLGSWGRIRGGDVSKMYEAPQMKMALDLYKNIDPELPAVILEMSRTWELLHDSLVTAAVRDDGITFDLTMRLL